jgi:hypothetical protein
MILHSSHKKFNFELISVALITGNTTNVGNISHIMDVVKLLQHNKWNTHELKKNEVCKIEGAAIKFLKYHLLYQFGKSW